MRKSSHHLLLVLIVSACGVDRRLGGDSEPGSTDTGGTAAQAGTSAVATGAVGGTSATASTVSAGSNGYGTGGVQVTTAGGTASNSGASANGGGSSGGDVSLSTRGGSDGGTFGGLGGVVTGGVSSGGRAAGGAPSGGTTNGGGSGGATGGMIGGATSIAGAPSGGTGGCIDVCGLYGASCCLWQTSCLGPQGSCSFDILAASVGTTYEYADLETKVAALPQDISASFTDQDIAWVAADPWAAARVEMHLTDDAAARLGAVLDDAIDGRVFRVSCGGKSLFVGVFYLIYGAAALNTPVLHEARENGVLVLRLGARQGAWYSSPGTGCTTLCQRVDRIELRAAFCRRGIMHELDPNARPLTP